MSRPENVAVVTGGSSGIGEAVARRLERRGWQCVLLARGRERLERVAAELGAEAEVCDVADEAQVRAVAERVLERHPLFGLLVNNAGIPGRTGFVSPAPERIEPILRVNYLGTVWSTLAFLPGLERSRPSHIVNVVSVAGTVAVPISGPYSAAKHAQLAFSRALTAELAPRGISVHTVNPGLVETPGFPQRRRSRNALERRIVIDADDVARAILGAIDHGRREIFVPRWYRIAPLAQALLPAAVARFVARSREPVEDASPPS
ncbi:MAG: SDR family NAD(P)-dependent oxidoreductase [Gaiellaceae bacterium]